MNYTELEVWQRAVDLVIDVYLATTALPGDERYGLALQMRRAAVSVASNIAEGEGRRTRRDHGRFLLNARGSLFELQTQIVICERLRYLRREAAGTLRAEADSVGRLINGTLRYLTRAANHQPLSTNR